MTFVRRSPARISRARGVLLALALLSLTGCKATLDEGKFACRADDECPTSWVCREDRRCWATAIPPGPTRGDIVPLGGIRSNASGSIVVKDDGFEASDRTCTSSGLCASGSLGR